MTNIYYNLHNSCCFAEKMFPAQGCVGPQLLRFAIQTYQAE